MRNLDKYINTPFCYTTFVIIIVFSLFIFYILNYTLFSFFFFLFTLNFFFFFRLPALHLLSIPPFFYSSIYLAFDFCAFLLSFISSRLSLLCLPSVSSFLQRFFFPQFVSLFFLHFSFSFLPNFLDWRFRKICSFIDFLDLFFFFRSTFTINLFVLLSFILSFFSLDFFGFFQWCQLSAKSSTKNYKTWRAFLIVKTEVRKQV